jgi:chromosome segregation ATPase
MLRILLSFFSTSKGLIIAAIILAAIIAQYEVRLHIKNNEITELQTTIDKQKDVISKYELTSKLLETNISACHDQIDKIGKELEAQKIQPTDVIKTVEKVKTITEQIESPINESCQEKLRYYEDLFQGASNVR